MASRPNLPDPIQRSTATAGSDHSRSRFARLVGPGALIVLLAAGSAFGANRGCVSAPLHGASQTIVGQGPAVTTRLTFSGQTAYGTSQVWIAMGKIVAPGTLASSAIVGGGPIFPDANGNFSQTLDVRRDGGGGNGVLWNDDDAVGFMLFEFDKVNGTGFTPLDTYQVNPGYSLTPHGIAAVSDRPDVDKLPHEISLGFFVAPPLAATRVSVP